MIKLLKKRKTTKKIKLSEITLILSTTQMRSRNKLKKLI